MPPASSARGWPAMWSEAISRENAVAFTSPQETVRVLRRTRWNRGASWKRSRTGAHEVFSSGNAWWPGLDG
ncbi:hypothetical protein BEK98_43720 [Streptomyces diastatochromogenes]|uniref:Uncharacterized protein n=1 Tax=Streptomyces diastatochromogenes TaxID=42236 RepID=A0A233RVP9_STRDA|nr:hypothetical protein BEK98_43720 [Streptomyces diastatochromogenes]